MKRDTYSIAQARNHLASLVHDVEKGPPVALTRRGKPVAVLLSVADYERVTRPKQSYWEALQAWRDSVKLEDLDAEEVFKNVQDRSAGSDFSW